MKLKTDRIYFNPGNLFFLAYYVMIPSVILNTNEFIAAFVFIPLQTIFAFACTVFFGKWNVKRLASYVPVVLVALVFLVSTYLSKYVSLQMNIINPMIFIVLFILMTWHSIDEKNMQRILKYYALLSLGMSLIVLFNAVTNNCLDAEGRASLAVLGVRKDQNYLTAFFTLGFTYFVLSFIENKGKRKLWHVVAALIIFAAIFETGSRGALVTALLVIALLFCRMILKNGITLKSVLAVIGVMFAFVLALVVLQKSDMFARMTDGSSYSGDIRWQLWSLALDTFKENMLIGSGYGAGASLTLRRFSLETHSCVVDILTSTGLVGFGLFALMFFRMWRSSEGNRFFMMLVIISLFVPLVFLNGFDSATFWVPFALCRLISDCCKEISYKKILWM